MKRILTYLLWVGLLVPLSASLALAQIPQVQYGIRTVNDSTYQVYMRMSSYSSVTGNDSRISSAQVTLRIPTGTVLARVQGRMAINFDGDPERMTWTFSSARVNRPRVCADGQAWTSGCTSGTALSAFDYISFNFNQFSSPVRFDITAGQDLELFTFVRRSACAGPIELFNNTSDPFRTPNSANTNVGNQMTMLVANLTDVYTSNLIAAAPCPNATGPADLSLSISGPATLTAGVSGTYAINLLNVGTGATSGAMSVTTLLPPGLVYGGSITANGWSCTPTTLGNGNTQVVCGSSASIAVGAAASYSFGVTAAANVATATFSAGVLGGGDLNVLNNTAQKSLTVVQPLRPDLSVSVSGAASLTAGSGGGYTFTVSNAAGSAATSGSTSLTFSLPAGLTYNGFSGTGWNVVSALVNGVTVYTATYLSAIGAGAAAPALLINVQVPAGTSSAMVNWLGGVATAGETNLINNGFSQQINLVGVIVAPALSVALVGPVSLVAGSGASYTLIATNGGNAATTGLSSLTFTLPMGLSYNGFSGSGWNVISALVGGQTVYTASYAAALAVGGSTVPLVLNLLSGSGVGGTQVVLGGSATTPGQVLPGLFSQNISITAFVGAPLLTGGITAPATMPLGSPFSLSVNLTNSGTGATTGPITTALSLPAGFVYNGFSGTGWSVSSLVLPNGTTSLTLTYPAGVGAGQTLPTLLLNTTPVNVPTPSTQFFTGGIVTPGSPSLTINLITSVQLVQSVPNLAVTLSGPATVTASQAASYTIGVSNSVGATTGPVTVTFTLPNGLAYNGLGAINGWGVNSQVVNGQIVYVATNSSVVAAGGSALPLILNVLPSGSVSGLLGQIVGGVGTIGEVVVDALNNFSLSVSLLVPQLAPVLSVTATGPGTLAPGGGGSYTLTVRNTGGPTTGLVSVTFVAPTGLSYNGFSGSGWNVTSALVGGQTVYTASYLPQLLTGGTTSPLLINWLAGLNTGGTQTTFGGSATTPGQTNPTNVPFSLPISISGGSSGQSANLSASILVLNNAPNLYGSVPVQFVVTNSGPNAATGVVSHITLPFGNPITAQLASLGTFNAATGQWQIGMISPGQSVTLTLTFAAVTGGIASLIHQIIVSPVFDPNSTPGNNAPGEDDMAMACFSVPVELCAGQTVVVNLTGTYTHIQWRRNGQDIAGATGTSLTITQAGTYTVDTNLGCGTGGCCPLIVRENTNCCTGTICAPLAIRKTR